MKRSDRARLGGALALTALMAALAAAPVMAQKRGGTLVVGSEAEFNGFEHLKVRAMNSNTLAPAITVMEGLFAYVADDRIEPRLGLELKEAPDRLSAEVTLRRNVKFHDGTPFNAAAVVFHYQRVLDPANNIGAATLLSPVTGVEAIDDHTVRFKLKYPWAALKSALALDSIVNLIGSPTAIQKDPDAFFRKPVGTGPFKFDEWRPGDRVIQSRNSDYWDPKHPYVDQLIFRIVPDDVTLQQSVKSGDIHMALANSPRAVAAVRKDKSLQMVSHVGDGTTGWGFNHAKPPFDDVRVRRAMAMAFNSQDFADGFFMGTVKPADGLFAPTSPWYCGGKQWVKYDLNAAKALLKEVGKPVQVQLNSTNTPSGRRMAAISQQYAQEAGFDAKIMLVDQAQHVRNFVAGDFQMASWRPQTFGGDPDHTISAMYGSERRTISQFSNAEVNALIEAGRKETDFETRKKIYCQIEKLVAQEAVLVMPIRLVSNTMAQLKVKGIPAPRGNIAQVRGIWLE